MAAQSQQQMQSLNNDALVAPHPERPAPAAAPPNPTLPWHSYPPPAQQVRLTARRSS